MLKTGTLNRQVTIQRRDGGKDEYGQLTDTWVNVATVWASILHKSGLETVKSSVDISVVQTSVRIRYREDVTAAMRVVYGNTLYDIRAVMPDVAGREYCDLVCQETT